MLNIVIPMAGAGSRFANAGYIDPKPLISVKGIPMIKVVIDNLKPIQPHRFIFICQKDHVKRYELSSKLREWTSPNSEIIELNGITDGAACTVLTASSLIDNNESLMIANSDQYVDVNIDHYLKNLDSNCLDGLIMTMKASDPKWSFARLGLDGLVNEVVEKKVISNEATVGIYNFKFGSDFVAGAKKMIANNDRVGGEFYVAPVFNQLIANDKKIGIYNIGSEGAGMYGLGIPSDLEYFLNNPISTKIF